VVVAIEKDGHGDNCFIAENDAHGMVTNVHVGSVLFEGDAASTVRRFLVLHLSATTLAVANSAAVEMRACHLG
jgi:hypothetical protein